MKLSGGNAITSSPGGRGGAHNTLTILPLPISPRATASNSQFLGSGAMSSFFIRYILCVHVLIESAATLGFLLAPSRTFSTPQTQAEPVIRQYGLFLLAANLVIIALLNADAAEGRPCSAIDPGLLRTVAGALSIYHIGPASRAASRFGSRDKVGLFNSPHAHFLVHVFCGGGLVAAYFGL